MDNVSREIKSSLFIDYFGKDEIVGKRNFLDLYNGIHGTNLKYEETRLEIKEIDNTVYHTFQNDLGMLVNDTFVVLMEHQSTVNLNMPLRLLEYITKIYSGMVDSRKRYAPTLVTLPTPEFYVFYNGKAPMEPVSTLKLSSAFMAKREHPMLELEVEVYNINYQDLPNVRRSGKLQEYTKFINFFYENANPKDSASCERVLNEAVNKKLMDGYLERKIKEVRNMLCAEYSYEEDIAVKQEYAFNNGLQQGISQGIAQGISQGISIGIMKAYLQMLQDGEISREAVMNKLNINSEQLDSLLKEQSQK